MHDFNTEVSAVNDVSPGVDDTALGVDDGLIEVESLDHRNVKERLIRIQHA